MNHIFIDTETNGFGSFRPAKQSILQISWIFNKIERDFYISDCAKKINPKVPHNITIEQIQKEGKKFKEVMKILLKDLLKTDVIVAHNIDFDIGCIKNQINTTIGKNNELSKKICEIFEKNEKFCTMKRSTKFCAIRFEFGGYKWPKLSELHFKLFNSFPKGKLHDSMYDVQILEKCFIKGNEMSAFQK